MDSSTAGDIPAYWTDLAVIGILLISGLLALFRGLVREVMSLANWLGALAITGALVDRVKDQFTPAVARMMAKHSDDLGKAVGTLNNILPSVFAAITIFVVSLAVLSLITHFIAKTLENSPLGPINRSLGFVFGLVRGYLVVALIFVIFSWLYPDQRQQPKWLAEAKTYALMASGAGTLEKMLPADLSLPGMNALEEKLGLNQKSDAAEEVSDPENLSAPTAEPGAAELPPASGQRPRGAATRNGNTGAFGSPVAPSANDLSRVEIVPRGETNSEDNGYDSESRRGIDQLMESTEE